MNRDNWLDWLLTAVLVAAVCLCIRGCGQTLNQRHEPEKIIDATHVQTRDGKIHTVLPCDDSDAAVGRTIREKYPYMYKLALKETGE